MALQNGLLFFTSVQRCLMKVITNQVHNKLGCITLNQITRDPVHYSTSVSSSKVTPLQVSPYLVQLSQLLSSNSSRVPRPKKPLTSFFLFKKDAYPKIARNHPDRTVIEISKELGQQWRDLSREERVKYIDAARQESLRYKEEFERLTADQKQQIQDQIVERRKKIKTASLKRKLRELHRPKRPINKYALFVKDRVTTRGTTPPRDFVRQVAAEWSSMSGDQKKPYAVEAGRLADQYKLDMANWEKRMKDEGHPEVVRGYRVLKTRRTPKKTTKKKATPKKGSSSKRKNTAKSNTQKKPESINAAPKKRSTKKTKQAEAAEDASWMREE